MSDDNVSETTWLITKVGRSVVEKSLLTLGAFDHKTEGLNRQKFNINCTVGISIKMSGE